MDLLAIQETNIDNVFDNSIHNYYNAEAKDCVIYYIYGSITNNFTKNITCDVCRTAVMGQSIKYSQIKNTFILKLHFFLVKHHT